MAPSSQAERDLEQAVRAYCSQYAASYEDAPPVTLLCDAVKESLRTVYGNVTLGLLKAFLRSLPDKFAIVNKKGPYGNNRQLVVCFGVATNTVQALQPAQRSNATYCGLCRRQFLDEHALAAHITSAGHRAQQLQRLFLQQGGLQANNAADGLMVSTLPELEGLLPNEAYLQQLLVTNVGTQPQLLVSCAQMRALPEISISGGASESKRLQPGETCTVEITIRPSATGWLRSMIILDFGTTCLARLVSASCEVIDPTLPDISAASEFKRRPRPARAEPATQVVPGIKPPRAKGAFLHPPADHKVPSHVRGLFEGRQWDQLDALLRRGIADVTSHADKLTLLLYVEELQQQLDVRQYDMEGVELVTSGKQLLALEVPGLAENRPSVLRGDALYATPVGEERAGREYQGFVHMVRQLEVLLRFHSSFPGHNQGHHIRVTNRRLYNVRFSIKRSTLVFMHEAVALLRSGVLDGSLVLPGTVPAKLAVGGGQTSAPQLAYVNRNLNEEQRRAVQAVVAGNHAPQPYLIFGPPGTGKTSTLVEAAVQVLRAYPSSKLLLAAPSNDAADLLALRLLGAGRPKSEILRINAYQRPKEALHEKLLDVSTWDDGDGAFRLPERGEIERKRVVVVTCLMAAKVHARGVDPGHFTHIMMDEAGHAEEPLALAVMAGLAAAGAGAAGTPGAGSRVVLAGDPRQLGPIIQSRLAKQHGLDVSLMERLLGRQPYAPQGGTYDSCYITQLVRNYRSHPQLLSLPSRLFYDNKLQACADPIITDSLLEWEELPNPRFPLLFHAVVGKDEQEGSSPSWFNVHEARLVLQYVTALRARRRNPIAATEIGIITPYRRQVQKVRRLLEAKGLAAVKVGSVEEFQGQERRVVIISTVRSSSELLDTDLKHRLGFVASPKRFNVAITRAQAGVIIIGNPEVLASDPHWRALLQHAADHNACKGAPKVADVLDSVRPAAGSSSSSGNGGRSASEEEGMAGMETLFARLGLGSRPKQGAWDGYSANEIEGGAQRRLM